MEIEDLTLQLRRAYRLVHGYQNATIDLAREIATRLGLEFCRWSPVFNNAPGRYRTDITRNWKWDLLPAYSLYIAFTSPGPIERGSYMLILWAEADTGFSKLCEESRGEPDFRKLEAPEGCATNFWFWHSVVVDDGPKTKDSQTFWNKLWHSEWPEEPEFAHEVESVKLTGRLTPYPLSALSSVEGLNSRLDELKAVLAKSA
jgi:hypothetical protein